MVGEKTVKANVPLSLFLGGVNMRSSDTSGVTKSKEPVRPPLRSVL